jgi:hypothetical protein
MSQNFLGGEGSKIFRKVYCRFVIIPRGPKNFLKKRHILAETVKNFFKNAILGGGRVAFNKNFIGGGRDTLIIL